MHQSVHKLELDRITCRRSYPQLRDNYQTTAKQTHKPSKKLFCSIYGQICYVGLGAGRLRHHFGYLRSKQISVFLELNYTYILIIISLNIKPDLFNICVSMVENLRRYTPLIVYPFPGSRFQSQVSTTPSYKKMLNSKAHHSSTGSFSQTSNLSCHLHASPPTPQPKEYISTTKKI